MKLLICTQAVDADHPILGFFIGWINEFAKHFDEVHVICLQKGSYELPSHVHIYSLGKEEGENRIKYLFRFYRNFSHIFFTIRVDYVFYHMGAIYNIVGAPFFLLRKFYGTTFYWWKAHGHINAFGRFALFFADRVYTSTESGFPIATPKRMIVGQAIDMSLFTLPPDGSQRKKEMIFVGRIMRVKHIEDFVRVAQRLSQGDASWSFSIIGPIGDEGYYREIVALCEQYGLAERIAFLGAKTQKELAGIYQRALVFLNTSQTHSMDKTLPEAALCGCIPITANHAFEEMLEGTGLYLERPDIALYTDAVRDAVKSGFPEGLREQIREKHSLDTFSSRIFSA